MAAGANSSLETSKKRRSLNEETGFEHLELGSSLW